MRGVRVAHKRIAFVLDTMSVGGVEKALIEVLRTFDHKTYDVTLWLRDNSGPLQNLIDQRVKIEYWGCSDTRSLLKEQINAGKIGQAIRGVAYRGLSRIYVSEYDLNALYSTKCLPLCTNFIYDCIVAYQVLSPAVVATALYRLRGKKKVLWVHGRNVRPKKLNRFFDREYNRFDYIACVSESTREDFGKDFPKSTKKTATIYNLFNISEIEEKAVQQMEWKGKSTALVTVGRLVSVKGQQMVPATVRLLLDAGYDIHWYLVGDGPLRETVEAEMEKHNVADRVHLLGTQMNPYPYIKNCDIYVQPSFSEGWGLTVQEARVLQKPIVVTPLPVMYEQIISGENGLIVDSMTPEALFEGIKTLLDNPELMEKFRSALATESHDNSGELQKLYDFIES